MFLIDLQIGRALRPNKRYPTFLPTPLRGSCRAAGERGHWTSKKLKAWTP